jgi:hypothetical protein
VSQPAIAITLTAEYIDKYDAATTDLEHEMAERTLYLGFAIIRVLDEEIARIPVYNTSNGEPDWRPVVVNWIRKGLG